MSIKSLEDQRSKVERRHQITNKALKRQNKCLKGSLEDRSTLKFTLPGNYQKIAIKQHLESEPDKYCDQVDCFLMENFEWLEFLAAVVCLRRMVA